jgi:hypothetical protein
MQPDPGIARTLLGERQKARYHPGRHPGIGLLEKRHLEPQGPAQRRRLDASTLKRLQESENHDPCDRRRSRFCDVVRAFMVSLH